MNIAITCIGLLKCALLLLGMLVGSLTAGAGMVPATAALEAERKLKPSSVHHRRTTCRICESTALTTVLDLGAMPLANAFRSLPDLGKEEPRYPLAAARCERCGLVQVPDVVDPSVLFSRYAYFSSASQPMVEHFRVQAEIIRSLYLPRPSDLICEIGSNDGIFLQNFVGKCRVIGVDPADNIATTAALKGVTTVNRFFNPQTARTMRDLFGAPRVIFAANCFAHIDDIHGVMEGVRTLLSDDGVFIFENHRFADMLRSLCFDQIYHEHLCYYTIAPVDYLVDRYGMRIVDVRTVPTHGESFQIHVAFRSGPHPVQPSVAAIREQEQTLGLNDPATFRTFTRDVQALCRELGDMIRQFKSEGKRIVGYGAPGKGTTLLNACGITQDSLEYIVDSTPIKQGLYMPGTRIPILPSERLASDTPDYVLMLAWNYADSILQREADLRSRGVKFIIPIPRPRIV